MKIGSGRKVLQASGAVALAGLCVTGVASGIACPILMGAAGTLAFTAFSRKGGSSCPACLPVPESRNGNSGDLSGKAGQS